MSARYPSRMRPTPQGEADVAGVARLLADQARTTMLFALSDGRALSAGALARAARVAPATASAHLSKLVTAGLLAADRAGRHRYYRLANPSIIHALEALAAAAPVRDRAPAGAGTIAGIRLARTCYDHLAGVLGVGVTDALVARGWLAGARNGYEVTAAGEDGLAGLGVDVREIRRRAEATRRAFARACLDWSERRYHLAGALGARLCERLLELEWVERLPSTRALRVSNTGRRALRRHFDVMIF